MGITIRKEDRMFTGIIVLVHIVFFLLATHYSRIYMGDSFEYIYEAVNIKRYFFFYSGNPAMPIVPEYMTQRQPLYPLLLAALYIFSVNNWVMILMQNLLSVFNILFMRNLLAGIGYQKKYDWLLLLLVAGYPAQFINANTIAPDILLQTCTLLYTGSYLRFVDRRQNRQLLWMGAWLVAGMMVKPVLYPFVIVHLVIVVITSIRKGLRLQRPLAIAMFPVCAVLLYNYWNYTRTGKFHFSSNQAFNATYYFYPFFANHYGADSAAVYLATERKTLAAIPEFKDRYDQANEDGIRLLQEHFFSYMAFHLKHSFRILVEPGKAEIDLFTGKLTYGRLYAKEHTGFYDTFRKKGIGGLWDYSTHNPSLIAVIAVLLINCIRLLGFLLFLWSGAGSREARWFLAGLIFYFAVAAGPIANTRYFLPVSLLMIGCAATGLSLRRNGKNLSEA